MPGADLKAEIGRGLERLCEGAGRERIVAAPAANGLERIEARFFGDAYARHRHDTYAIGLTLSGVQRFWYRGAERVSRTGQIIVLHPDEVHDGGAGDETGLSYRMLYVEPALIAEALDEAAAPPFVAEPVINDAPLAAVLAEALSALDAPLDELARDDLVGRLARALIRRAGRPARPLAQPATRQAKLARDYLDAHATRAVSSIELARAAGIDRYALARHFCALYATSPHRLSVDAPAGAGARADRRRRAARRDRRSDRLRRPGPLHPPFQEGLRPAARPLGGADGGVARVNAGVSAIARSRARL
jgi:AraC-like DNA-binding protein